MKFDKPADKQSLDKTIESLKQNGISSQVAQSHEDAKNLVLGLIPKGSEVMTMSSVTLDTLGISDAINTSKDFDAVKPKLYQMDRNTDPNTMQKLGAAPQISVGSVHAVTENGQLVIASNTGSQLPGYAYGSRQVILVVGTQKIVPDLDTAFKRIYEHTLPLESERARVAYGVDGSFVSKLLIINREVNPDRIKVIFVPSVIGY